MAENFRRSRLITQFAQRARGEAQQRNRSSSVGNLNAPVASINRPQAGRVSLAGDMRGGFPQRRYQRGTQTNVIAGSKRAGQQYRTFTKRGPGGALASYHEYTGPGGKRQVFRVGKPASYT